MIIRNRQAIYMPSVPAKSEPYRWLNIIDTKPIILVTGFIPMNRIGWQPLVAGGIAIILVLYFINPNIGKCLVAAYCFIRRIILIITSTHERLLLTNRG